MFLRCLAVIVALAASAARAEPPRVVADVPPVHGLLARVMQGVGAPTLLLPADASPHGYAMRPSEAARLAAADIVFWTGPALTPWLGRAIGSLAPDARSVVLLDVPGTHLLGFRERALFDGDDHEPHEGAPIDPHAWLDPENAKVWTAAIAEILAQTDPANANAYRRNAAGAAAEIDAMAGEITARLAPIRGRPYLVLHDAYGYFERRFAIPATGAIAPGDASRPGAARLAALRARIKALPGVCVFSEPRIQARVIRTVTEGTRARIAMLDPLGSGLEPGPGHYGALMEGLATALAGCLGR